MKKYVFWLLLFTGLAGAFAPQAFAQTGQLKPNRSTFTMKDMALHQAMLKLMSDHITWQRVFAVETITGAKDIAKARDRLNKNLDEIGNAFKPFYGDDTGSKVSDLFKQHVQLLADYTNTARNKGDTTAFTDQMNKNADALAALLSQKNPNWRQPELAALFRDHSSDMVAEVNQQINSPGMLNVEQMDKSSDRGVVIADTLTFGIMNQHPDKLK